MSALSLKISETDDVTIAFASNASSSAEAPFGVQSKAFLGIEQTPSVFSESFIFYRESPSTDARLSITQFDDPFLAVKQLSDGWAGPDTVAPDEEFIEKAEGYWRLLDGVFPPSVLRPSVRAGACNIISFSWIDKTAGLELHAWIHNQDRLKIEWRIFGSSISAEHGTVRTIKGLVKVIRRFLSLANVKQR